ncbi:MAG: hypothetical protein A3I26_03415 [Candidatus Yanofskybacteria bacterium RIFCSPLOWO2_02_FULL_43_10]|uniref:Peptidase C60 sortase A and B n=1 Tax=Candidatus Yanofskybacteria bacterium RIFCSPLOWO2_12_FULL_43_11b TaxID=1802710 RepID=A0A1F8HA00_9BACT|nr:MAG: hypothetical protein A2742_00495 [Candidatus Yanofskybacteria bacterium RIFCSPHIGHO2_01_FULL_43_32]OGN11245.1 MAG: hypothetical protein A3C69_00630 [Candidatus Yanofskybacteria bacterium RIFCSPHIGHO2_02_FULL_43_12]OGN17875.1 MAG: hypothetical protein A3E34_00355 [Candidatus Yanofskybacteria bacterium RIFCSPHIGHO2_12_FULL_43_11]OGN24165.1 MAG: hypothetical protein A2923_02435 [Candidatus Yanofskybacteria bacterium RIFCSPLOWO2_01_FULL_43_46]OGN28674.1 MAG: hypothetical protein A3I26_03415
MQLKTPSKRTSVTAVLAGFVALSPALFLYFIPKISTHRNPVPITENVVVLQTQEQTSVGLPLRLKIPVINIDSAVEYVGLDFDGAMDVPKSQDNVGWFEIGSRPGGNGSAVIAGHYGQQNNKGSVFDDLHKLRKGDKLYVEDEKGAIVAFVVRESRRYDPKADASEVFSSSDGKAHLNLVTCEGVWDEATQQYPKRLVLFTDREE